MHACVFSHQGLGDGINLLALSHNLHLNGWQVVTYHNTLGQMASWFPHLEIRPYPEAAYIGTLLVEYDCIFVVHNDTDPFILSLVKEGKRRCPDKIKIFYFYPSTRVVNEPYYKDTQVNPKWTILKNICRFCENTLHLSKVVYANGMIPPERWQYRKYPKRVVIHPSSSRLSRNWPEERFLEVAKHLEDREYQVTWIPGAQGVYFDKIPKESVGHFCHLSELAGYIYESGFLIGNDSGLGHLAASLKIPTITICRRKTHAQLWRPAFSNVGVVVTPPSWVPNLKGLRWRDRYWKYLIRPDRVLKIFNQLSLQTEIK